MLDINEDKIVSVCYDRDCHNGLVDVSIKLIDKVAEETKLQDKEGK